MPYIKELIEQSLNSIFNLPEIANVTRKGNWTALAELKDENGIYDAVVTWQFLKKETANDGFILMIVTIGARTWYFRGIRVNDDDHMFYVGSTPQQLQFNAWYDGGAVSNDPRCTRCKTSTTRVNQAYYGGRHIRGVARCLACQQHPFPIRKAPPFNAALIPPHT